VQVNSLILVGVPGLLYPLFRRKKSKKRGATP
jgi:hypothetical protein